MSEPSIERDEGVYYRREDYVGVWRRLLIEGIDFSAASVVSLAVTVLLLDILAQTQNADELLGITCYGS